MPVTERLRPRQMGEALDPVEQAALDELKAQMDETFASGQREAAEAELAAQQAALAVERQLQAQQAKYNEQLQTELAAARRRPRPAGARGAAMQRRLEELARTPAADGVGTPGVRSPAASATKIQAIQRGKQDR